jgi:hypothetical protein
MTKATSSSQKEKRSELKNALGNLEIFDREIRSQLKQEDNQTKPEQTAQVTQ